MSMRRFTLALLTFTAATETIQYGASIDSAWAVAMAPRDGCPGLPELCTGPVMVHGTGMTLTYLCPKTAEAPTTVHVTITQTTTITAAPTSVAAAPPKDSPISAEPTTITTVHTTATSYRTIIVTRKSSEAVAPGLTTNSTIQSASQIKDPDTTRDWLHIPTSLGPEPDITSDWLHPITTSAPGNSSTSGLIFFSKGSSVVSDMLTHRNCTGYAFPTLHYVRQANSSASVKPSTGDAGKNVRPVITLVLSMMIVMIFGVRTR